MTVTVRNEAAKKTQPYVFVIEERRRDNIPPQRITLGANPQQWERSFAVNWRTRGAAGVVHDRSDWESNEPSTISISDYRMQMEPDKMEGTLLALESLAQQLDEKTLEPPLVTVRFGIHVYQMALTRLNVRRVQTDARGYATEAIINMEFVENLK